MSSYEEILTESGILFVKTVGTSMRPLIKQGRDIVVVKPISEKLKRLDVVLYATNDEDKKYVLHRILKVNADGTFFVAGDNNFNGETIKEEQIIGVMTGLIRGEKIKECNKKSMRIYSHLRCDAYTLRFFRLKLKSKIIGFLVKIKHLFRKK